MFYKFACLLLVVSRGYAMIREPRCYSRFDFEEKLLEKIVTMGVRLQVAEEKVERKLRELSDISNNMQEKIGMEIAALRQEKSEIKRVQNESVYTIKDFSDAQKKVLQGKFDELDRRLVSNGNAFEKMTKDFKQLVNASLNSVSEKLVKADVAFHVKKLQTLKPGKKATLIFTEAMVNENNAYNITSGVFNAPVRGTYFFSVQLCNKAAAGFDFGLFVNEVQMTSTDQTDKTYAVCTSVSVTATLKAGDKVTVRTGSAVSTEPLAEDDRRWNTFTGVLAD